MKNQITKLINKIVWLEKRHQDLFNDCESENLDSILELIRLRIYEANQYLKYYQNKSNEYLKADANTIITESRLKSMKEYFIKNDLNYEFDILNELVNDKHFKLP